MTLVLITGVLLVGTAVALSMRAVAMPRIRASERLAEIEAYGFPAEPKMRPGESTGSLLERLAARFGGPAAAQVGESHEAECRKLLTQAGIYGTPYETFIGYRLLTGSGAALGCLWTLAPASPVLGVVAAVLAGLVGWTLPFTIVRTRAERRQAQVEYDLPELIDLLVVTVEAGLSFSASLQLAATRLSGPLRDELGLALQEQRMGLTVPDSLAGMLERCDGPGMRSFVRSVLQGETLGVSIGDIMRNLAVEMRKRRRAAAEERAQKAPVKMLFPLIFLIFPAMFVVLLYPAIRTVLDTFGGV